MMLPPAMAWPPKIFTPSRWPAESRPFREEPPAFLCAIVSAPGLSSLDLGDLQLGEWLTVTPFSVRVLTPLLLESDDLLATALLQDLACDGGSRDQRCSGLW